jgi:DNA replication and repair protein RecF
MSASALTRLQLADFRSYAQAALEIESARSVFLFGPNGAGKTNLLEAVSFLAPGRGLRNAAIGDVGRREPKEEIGRAWGVSAVARHGDGDVRMGTGIETPQAARRTVRIEGETVQPGRLLEHLRLVWLTPAQDRLFAEGRTERLRFFDRLVFAGEPEHAAEVSTYERALRERLKLLVDGPQDPAWLKALETRLGESGARVTLARRRTLEGLRQEIEARSARPFPSADIELEGPAAEAAAQRKGEVEIAAEISEAMAKSRARDASAGRSLSGPHRSEIAVIHRERGRPAAECSTGEQKALVLNLILAQAARLSRAKSQPNPILLLDEVAAHLDPSRRSALFDEITALGLQAFLTGTEEALFEDLKGRALGVRVERGSLSIVE